MDNTEHSKQGEVVAVGRSTQLVINFAPDSTDTNTLRLKCMNFWRVIEEGPDMNWWSAVSKNKPDEVPVTVPDVRSENRKPTAIDMLDFVEKKGLYDLVYGTKHSCFECGEDSTLHDIEEGNKPGNQRSTVSKPSLDA